MRCRRCHASLPPCFTKKQKQKKPTTTTSTRVHLNWPPRIECIACSPPSVWLSVSLLLSPSLSVSTTLQTHYKNLFHKISMPAKNDISAARVIDLPKKTNLIRKNVALTHWLTKKFAKYSRIAQNPWVSRCVLHLAMGTASNYGQGEFSTAKRERERVATLCQPCVFSMCATQSGDCKGILTIENEYII